MGDLWFWSKSKISDQLQHWS